MNARAVGLNKSVFLAASLVAMLAAAPVSASSSSPTLNLFPTTVVEDLKASAKTVKELEASLGGTIQRMDQQMGLYREAKCDGSGSDRGCTAIKQNISETYVEMLDQLGDKLPTMKRVMGSIQESLGKRIRTEIGRGMTPRDLQKLVENKGNNTPERLRNSRGTGSRTRFAKTFSRYYELVKQGGGAQSNNTAVLAAEIYDDARSAMKYLDLIQMEVDSARSMARIDGALMNGPSDEMIDTVNRVKILLGQDVGDGARLPPTQEEINGGPNSERDSYPDLVL
jgi:hypothetical protein